jgi:hypothetical protein
MEPNTRLNSSMCITEENERKINNQSDELHNLCASKSKIKSKRMGWATHVARFENARKILVRKREEDILDGQYVGGRLTIKPT